MITAVIPARLGSRRLPNKMLLDLGGKPLLQRVWEQACKMTTADAVYIATDSQKIMDQASAWGAQVCMTKPDCPSGTYRIASLLDQIEGDFFLNIQGDEPFIQPKLLDGLVSVWQDSGCDLVTAIAKIASVDALFDSNVVKAVINDSGRILYFSRSTIPFIRDVDRHAWLEKHPFWGHIGVYGYTREVLLQYPQLKPSLLETTEQLEQLRFLEHNFYFQAMQTDYHPLGIDTESDLNAAREQLRQSLNIEH